MIKKHELNQHGVFDPGREKGHLKTKRLAVDGCSGNISSTYFPRRDFNFKTPFQRSMSSDGESKSLIFQIHELPRNGTFDPGREERHLKTPE
jgi:hypothetical protein